MTRLHLVEMNMNVTKTHDDMCHGIPAESTSQESIDGRCHDGLVVTPVANNSCTDCSFSGLT